MIAPKIISSQQEFNGISKWLLLFAAFTCAVTALMGIFLSKEPGYNPDSLQWHKWSGITISFLTILWYIFFYRLQHAKPLLRVTAILSLVIIIFVGHEGGGITHGDNFLLAPVITEPQIKRPPFDEAVVFTDMVRPILAIKCMGCHNSRKAKGELVMETQELLLKGGKSGKLWDSTKAGFGLIFDRIHLPKEEKKHMPPAGKPQLTDEEITILYNWVKEGADFKIKVNELAETDTLKSIAKNIFNSSEPEENYDFEAANEKTVDELSSTYRTVTQIAKGSPALAVDFYGAAFFKPEQLKDLLKIKKQVVSLNLDKMPVTDDDLQTVGEFTNLRTLNLSFTKISGKGLSHLSKLINLKNLSLSNTVVRGNELGVLADLKKLNHVYVWNTAITSADIKTIKQKNPALNVDIGTKADTLSVRLNPPILETDVAIIDTPIIFQLKHYVPGITIKYTLNGTDPDSGQSFVYNRNIKLSGEALLKARAYKQGWLESELLQYQFYHANFKPDTIILGQPTDSLYKGKGSKTLYNQEKGDYNIRSGKWLGFRFNPMECLLVFPKPVSAQEITISSIVDRANSIFPPQNIEVWGGNDRKNLRLLAKHKPDTLSAAVPAYLTPFQVKFKQTNVRFIKVVATPIAQLPKDLVTPKNKKGWFFVDELFVN